MSNISIHVGGVYYGLHNIGDEAILLSIINSFQEFKMSVSSFGSEWIRAVNSSIEIRDIKVDYVKPKFGLYIDPKKRVLSNYLKVRREKKFYSTKEYYICGGATILSDCPWYSLKTVELAGDSGTPVILWGIGMAEVSDVDAIKYIKNVLTQSYVKKIFTRDCYVKKRLCELGVNSDKIFVSYDPAIMINGEIRDAEQFLTKKQKILYYNDSPNFVFSLSGETDVVGRTPINEIKNAIKVIQEKYRANIFLVPTGCGSHCEDMKLLQNMEDELNNPQVTAIKCEFTPKALVGFLKNVRIIVSSRLHLNIFGACAGTPSIGLVRNQKIIDFANILELPYLELEHITAFNLEKIIVKLAENYDILSAGINEKVKMMRNQYKIAVQDAISIIYDGKENSGE